MVVNPVRPGFKNHCAGEDQRQISSQPVKSPESLESAVSSWETDLSKIVADSRPLAEA
jgi:hypothetical protein